MALALYPLNQGDVAGVLPSDVLLHWSEVRVVGYDVSYTHPVGVTSCSNHQFSPVLESVLECYRPTPSFLRCPLNDLYRL